jgi:hypothetical protein
MLAKPSETAGSGVKTLFDGYLTGTVEAVVGRCAAATQPLAHTVIQQESAYVTVM